MFLVRRGRVIRLKSKRLIADDNNNNNNTSLRWIKTVSRNGLWWIIVTALYGLIPQYCPIIGDTILVDKHGDSKTC